MSCDKFMIQEVGKYNEQMKKTSEMSQYNLNLHDVKDLRPL